MSSLGAQKRERTLERPQNLVVMLLLLRHALLRERHIALPSLKSLHSPLVIMSSSR